MSIRKSRNRALFIFLFPAVLLYVLIYLYPTAKTVLMSFFSMEHLNDSISTWKWVGISNYVEAFTQSDMFRYAMRNLVKIWLVGGIFTLGIGVIFAFLLTSGIRGKQFFKIIIYLPNVISAVAIGSAWLYYVFAPKYGMLTTVFSILHLDGLAKIMWTSPKLLFWSMLIAFCFGTVGYFVINYTSGIERIPDEIFESADIDGFNYFQRCRYITWPLLGNVFRSSVVVWTVKVVGFYVYSTVFSTTVPSANTVMPQVYVYYNVFGSAFSAGSAPGIGASIGVVMMLVVILVMFFINKVLPHEVYEY